MTEFRAGLSLKVKKRGKTIVVIEEGSGLTMSDNGTINRGQGVFNKARRNNGTITREGAHPV